MKKTKKFFAAAAIFTTATSIGAPASADIFTIDYHDAGVWNNYDTERENYAMKFRSDQGKDGFWLVVTDGENPKGDGLSNAILYGDLENNRITAYTYNGENSSDSFRNGTLLGTYDGVFSSGGTHAKYGYEMTMFSLDVSELNNAVGPNFDGVQFGERAGIWFHQTAGTEFTYGADSSITDYAFDSQMWLDRGNDQTRLRAGDCTNRNDLYFCKTGTELAVAANNGDGTTSGGGSVPAPGGLALVLVGLAGLGRKFLKANKA